MEHAHDGAATQQPPRFSFASSGGNKIFAFPPRSAGPTAPPLAQPHDTPVTMTPCRDEAVSNPAAAVVQPKRAQPSIHAVDDTTPDPSAAPAMRFSFGTAGAKPAFSFSAQVHQSEDVNSTIDGPMKAAPRPVDPVAWKQWLSSPSPKPPTPFDLVMNSTSTRNVVAYLTALEEAQPGVPRMIASMIHRMVDDSADGPLQEIPVRSAMDLPIVQSPNWWRNVALLAKVDLSKWKLRLCSLHLAVPPVKGQHSALLSQFALPTRRTLRALRIDCPIAPSDFSTLTQLNNVHTVHFRNSLTNEGLAALGALPCLATLKIESCAEITDARELAGCRALTSLTLHNLPLIPEGLDGVETLPRLTTLVLSAHYVFFMSAVLREGRHVGLLGNAPALTDLTVKNIALQPDGVRGLEKCRTLKRLTLYQTGLLTDISSLAELATLDSFHVAYTRLTSLQVGQAVCGMPLLTKLILKSADGADAEAVMRQLNTLQQLQHLSLSVPGPRNDFGYDKALLYLEPHSTVESLSLDVGPMFGDVSDHDEYLLGIEKFPSVRSLSLNGRQLVEDSFVAVAQLPRLTSLAVISAQLQSATALCRIASLTRLELSACSKFDDEGVRNVARLPALTDLSLSRANEVTDVRPVLTAPSKLRRLSLTFMSVADAGFGVPTSTMEDLTLANCLEVSPFVCQHLLAAVNTLRKLTITGTERLIQHHVRLRGSMPRTVIITANSNGEDDE